MKEHGPIKDDPRTIFGWCMYDWANSAYVTTVAVGLLPRYFADMVVPPGGVVIGGATLAADTPWWVSSLAGRRRSAARSTDR